MGKVPPGWKTGGWVGAVAHGQREQERGRERTQAEACCTAFASLSRTSGPPFGRAGKVERGMRVRSNGVKLGKMVKVVGVCEDRF